MFINSTKVKRLILNKKIGILYTIIINCIQMKTKILSTRIDKEVLDEIEKIAKEKGVDRSSFIKQLVVKGLSEMKVKEAIEEYGNQKVSLSKAAFNAGLNIRDFLALLSSSKVELNYELEDLKEDLKNIKK